MFFTRRGIPTADRVGRSRGMGPAARTEVLVPPERLFGDFEEDIAFRRVNEVQECLARRRLAASALPHETEDLFAFHIEGDAIHGPNPERGATRELAQQAAPEREPDPEPTDPDQGAAVVTVRCITSCTWG